MCTSTKNTVGLRNSGGSVMTIKDDHIDIDGGGQWSYGWVIWVGHKMTMIREDLL